jgi:RNA polymerase sigma-70 factor (ECF subfamily)
MTSSVPGEITRLLIAWRTGDRAALNELVSVVYLELRRLARQAMRRQPGVHTLQTTALISEAFIKLAHTADVSCHDRSHFFALCAQLMRRILVDSARSRLSAKRGGSAWRVQFDEHLHMGELTPADLVRLDDALAVLEQLDPRKSRVIELRFFGGLTVDEAAGALGISRETVLRDWRFARAWLKSEMGGAANNG